LAIRFPKIENLVGYDKIIALKFGYFKKYSYLCNIVAKTTRIKENAIRKRIDF